jgi:hypothetical protein
MTSIGRYSPLETARDGCDQGTQASRGWGNHCAARWPKMRDGLVHMGRDSRVCVLASVVADGNDRCVTRMLTGGWEATTSPEVTLRAMLRPPIATTYWPRYKRFSHDIEYCFSALIADVSTEKRTAPSEVIGKDEQ